MEVILKEDLSGVGEAGEVVKVKDGYGRNYLIPKGIALEATKANLSLYQEKKKQRLMQENREKRKAQALAKKLENASFTIAVETGEEERMFEAVTSQKIGEILKEEGYEVDRRKIMIEEPIKSLGIYTIKIKLHPEVETQIKVWVVKK